MTFSSKTHFAEPLAEALGKSFKNIAIEQIVKGVDFYPKSTELYSVRCVKDTIVVFDGGKGNNIANYKTAKIGKQVWMAENLDYYVKGSECYRYQESNCGKYGRLYDWITAMALPDSCYNKRCSSQISAKHKGICPDGWHIPSAEDWNILMKFVNPDCRDDNHCKDAGAKLKATSGWNIVSGVPQGTDDYGFSALPSGRGTFHDDFYVGFPDVGDFGFWWSSSEWGSWDASERSMRSDEATVGWNHSSKSSLQSVRCVKD